MPNAKNFASALKLAFIKHSTVAHFGEIAQFRALMHSFRSLKPRFPVEEFHGSKHQIYFDTSKSWLPRKRARCELCDLLIIAYSNSNGFQVKMTLLQAKLSHSQYLGIGSAGMHGVDHVAFNANFEQWDLLANRPLLLPTTVFAPPPDLLSNAIVPSVGSYGVFHRDLAGNVDFFYAAADCIAPVGTPKRVNGKLETSPTMSRVRSVSGEVDVTYCSSIFQFAHALYRLEVGTPVVSTSSSGEITLHAPLIDWVRSTLAASVSVMNSRLALELLSYLPGSDEPLTENSRLLPNILLIKGESSLENSGQILINP